MISVPAGYLLRCMSALSFDSCPIVRSRNREISARASGPTGAHLDLPSIPDGEEAEDRISADAACAGSTPDVPACGVFVCPLTARHLPVQFLAKRQRWPCGVPPPRARRRCAGRERLARARGTARDPARAGG